MEEDEKKNLQKPYGALFAVIVMVRFDESSYLW